jgi:hypothetical protein
VLVLVGVEGVAAGGGEADMDELILGVRGVGPLGVDAIYTGAGGVEYFNVSFTLWAILTLPLLWDGS